MTTNLDAVADRLFAAIEAGDRTGVADLFDDRIEVWHSLTQRSVDKARSLAILNWLMAPGVERAYEIHERLVQGDRLAQRHTLRVTVPGHPVVVLPASIFLTISDGRVTRIDEYPDKEATDVLISIVPTS